MKACTRCKKSFSLENFYQKKNTRYYAYCKKCVCIHTNKYKLENKEKVALAHHRYINTEKGYIEEPSEVSSTDIRKKTIVKNGFLKHSRTNPR